MIVVAFWIVTALFTALIAAFVSMAMWQQRTGVPPQPSTPAERRAVIELLRDAGVEQGIIYELGCGWGGLARRLARAFAGAEIRAVEISPVPALWARLRAWPIANLTVRRCDIFATDIGDAAAVVSYLMDDANERLVDWLDRHLPPGTPVITVVFRFRGRDVDTELSWRGWQPGQVIRYRWQPEGPGDEMLDA